MELNNTIDCIEYIMSAYYQKRLTEDELERVVYVWQDQLNGIPTEVVIKAVRNVVAKKLSVPYVADIKKEIMDISISDKANEIEKKCYYILTNSLDEYEQERKMIENVK